MIYRISEASDWANAKLNGEFASADLTLEGFIHCSKESQVEGVLERYYSGVKNLRLLKIEEAKLTSPLKYEVSTGGELFPHLFGALNPDAVVEVIAIKGSD